ncbi:MAG TPA: L,D-transpeptidase family protein [Mycobacteriales bacterium]|nr:L,D-transpeptidase family protein [Mycobacteriales bacterium]
MLRAGFATIALTVLATACAPSGGQGAAPTPPSSGTPSATATPRGWRPPKGSFAPTFPAYAATATKPSVEVHAGAGGPVARTLANPQPSGAPLTFLLRGQPTGTWLQVFLPVRPNGSSGWVRATDVTVVGVPYRLDVLRAEHRLRLYDNGVLRKEFPVAIGTRSTPTPGGTFYLKELLIPTNAGGVYGPYAYGLSGFSNVLTTFGGGDGVIGIHGTNDESKIGSDVSHGCIRMRNADITYLAKLLPLGTPVRILR